MNSLRTLQALNQVVNHDICPQMKSLIEENKRLILKNNRCISNVEKYKKIANEQTELLEIQEENLVEVQDECETLQEDLNETRAELEELEKSGAEAWKDHFEELGYFKCSRCRGFKIGYTFEGGDIHTYAFSPGLYREEQQFDWCAPCVTKMEGGRGATNVDYESSSISNRHHISSLAYIYVKAHPEYLQGVPGN